MDLVFATNNPHKLKEIRALLDRGFRIYSLKELGVEAEIPEDYETLKENALQKAKYVFDQCGISCFADDTGLEVDALGGAPGVYSARYARIGEPVFPELEPSEANIRKLLLNLKDQVTRSARFRTVIALIRGGSEYLFEGVAEGRISDHPAGRGGFGYDPVFIPNGYNLTFAEMDPELKNRISHRGKAIHQLIQFLNYM